MSPENKNSGLEHRPTRLDALEAERASLEEQLAVIARLRQSPDDTPATGPDDISDRTHNLESEAVLYQLDAVNREHKQAERVAMGRTGLRRFFSEHR